MSHSSEPNALIRLNIEFKVLSIHGKPEAEIKPGKTNG